MNIKNFLNLAKQQTIFSDFDGPKVGCCVVYKNEVIATGSNMDKTDPLQKKYNLLTENVPDDALHKLHAEICALKQLRKENIDWRKVYVFIYRTRKDQEAGMARPCPACMKLISDLGIKHICYTTDSGYAQEKITKGR